MTELDLLSQLGIVFIILGLILLLIPLLIKALPKLEGLPPLILYVYRADGFVFATSPILILFFIVLLFLWWLK